MTRWAKLLDPNFVRSMVNFRTHTGEPSVSVDIDGVELKVTSHQAMYFIPDHLVDEFENLNVSFCVR